MYVCRGGGGGVCVSEDEDKSHSYRLYPADCVLLYGYGQEEGQWLYHCPLNLTVYSPADKL